MPATGKKEGPRLAGVSVERLKEKIWFFFKEKNLLKKVRNKKSGRKAAL